jgi:hypothetical protein
VSFTTVEMQEVPKRHPVNTIFIFVCVAVALIAASFAGYFVGTVQTEREYDKLNEQVEKADITPQSQPGPEPDASPTAVLFPRNHDVQEGERLWNLAGSYYGDPTKFMAIVNAPENVGKIGPAPCYWIYIGTTIVIPAPDDNSTSLNDDEGTLLTAAISSREIFFEKVTLQGGSRADITIEETALPTVEQAMRFDPPTIDAKQPEPPEEFVAQGESPHELAPHRHRNIFKTIGRNALRYGVPAATGFALAGPFGLIPSGVQIGAQTYTHFAMKSIAKRSEKLRRDQEQQHAVQGRLAEIAELQNPQGGTK